MKKALITVTTRPLTHPLIAVALSVAAVSSMQVHSQALGPVSGMAQVPPTAIANTPALTAGDRAELVAATVRELNSRYVFPDVAKRAGEALTAKLKARAYDAITDGQVMAKTLSDDLLALTKDAHLRFRFDPVSVPMQALPGQAVPQAQAAAASLEAQQRNFGVERVERLPGNIGYIDLRVFFAPSTAGDTIAAAMNLIAHTDALIVDVRQNGGGFSETVALFTSYLLEERTLLSSFYLRDNDSTEQSWTLDWVPGKRFGKTKPVYVLTSKNSVSGAEEFAYNLKHLKRATLVGESTLGASNPGTFVKLTPLFTLFIPNGRVVNAITKTNWERVGVEPDIKVRADDALRTAQILALKKIVDNERDPRRRGALLARSETLERSAPN